MRSFVYLLAVLSLISGGSASCFAQQTTGPATLENLLDTPERPPLNPTAKDKDTPFPPIAPDEAAVKEAQDLIKQAYEDDYKAAAKNPEPLIQKLLAAAGQTKDPVRRYAFLISAEEAAVTGGDVGRTMELIDIRADEFAIDGLQSRMDRLAEFLTPKAKTDPEVLARLYEHSIETAERGVKQDSLEQAKAAAEMAASIAKSIFMTGKAKKNDGVADDGEAKQTQARALVKEIERRAGLFVEYQKALETIKAKEDPAANGVIGRYLCFAVGDWKKGLPFLAKGDQKDLADVAGEELRVFADGTPDAKEVFSLAGKWWAAADAKDVPDSLETAVRSHAGGLYESIWERLDDPLDKAVALKRREGAQRNAAGLANALSPAPRGENAEDKIRVISVQYGVPERWRDVTRAVASTVVNNTLIASCYNQDFGDPAPGVRKRLVIRYAFGAGEEKRATCDEGDLPIVIHPKRQCAGRGFKVTKAVYGAGIQWKDVTGLVRNHQTASGIRLPRVDNTAMMADPAPGATKALVVFFCTNGQEQYAAFLENSPAVVP